MKKKRAGIEKRLNHIGKLVFFLNVFVSFLIITGAWLLVQTTFGKRAMIFGFVLLAVSTTLKFMHKW